MKTNAFKRILSIILALAFVVTVSAVYTVSGADGDSNSDNTTANVFDFSSDSHIVNAFAGNGVNEIKDEMLHITTPSAWQTARVLFPFELEAGKSYLLSFKYKVTVAGDYRTWVMAGKQSSDYGSWTIFGGNSEKNNRLAIAMDKALTPSESWSELTVNFVADENIITDTYKYLGLYIQPSVAGEIYIDDVKIFEPGGTVELEANGGSSVATLTGAVGDKVTLPDANRIGYALEGWYSDPELTSYVGTVGDEINLPAAGESLKLYAKWIKSNTTVIDFSQGDHIAGANGTVSVADGKLAMTANGGQQAYVRLPIKPELGKTYVVTLKYMADITKQVDENSSVSLAMDYAYETSAWTMCGADLLGYTGHKTSVADGGFKIADMFTVKAADEGAWNEMTCTFTVPESYPVNAEKGRTFEYLCFWIQPSGSKDTVTATVYIDKMTLSEAGGNVIFNTNGGSEIENMTGTAGSQIELPTASRVGYALEGWYRDQELTALAGLAGEAFNVPDAGIDVTLYAKWVKSESTVYDFSDTSQVGNAFSAEISNEELLMTAEGNSQSRVRLNCELEKDKSYSVTFKYKVSNAVSFNGIRLYYAKAVDNYGAWHFLGGNNENNNKIGDVLSGRIDNTTEWRTSEEYIFTATGVTDEYKYLGFWMQPDANATLYIDDVTIKEVVIKEDEPVESKTYDFETEDGIIKKPSSYTVENGTLVNKAGWSQRIGLDFILKNDQEYTITMKYKVELADGQDYQSLNIRWYAGSKQDVKQQLKSDGWLTWNNTSYKTFQSTLTITADQLKKSENYLWLDLNADSGTDDPKKGGGKIIIDSITVKEKGTDEKQEFLTEKTYNFDNEDGINNMAATYTVQNGTLVNKCGWDQRIGLDFALKNGQSYTVKIKYKVELAEGQKYQSANIKLLSGEQFSGSGDTLYNAGWLSLSNTDYRNLTAILEIKANQLKAGENYLWLNLDSDSGKDDPKKGGGKIIIDSISIAESKPVTPDTTKIFTFDNEDDIISLPTSANIENGTLVEKCGWGHVMSLNYTLAPNATYQLSFKYKVSGESSLNIGICSNGANRNTLGKIVTWLKTSNTEWTTKTVEFNTTDKNVNDSTRTLALYLDCDPAYGSYLIIDEIKVVRYDSVISFKASYNGLDLDIDSIGGATGETVKLPTNITKPYELQGWYYDSAFKKPAGKEITLGNNDITLYGKIKYSTKTVLDFEDDSYYYPISGANDDYIQLASDPDNADNTVLKTQIFKSFNSTYMRFNYMWQNSHKYKITLKYKVDRKSNVQIYARNSTINNTWDSAGDYLFDNLYASVVYGTKSPTGSEWMTAETEFTSDDPVVDNIYKYLFFTIRLTRNEGEDAPILYVDDIVIEDLGEFDPSTFVTTIDEYTWETVQENSADFTDWQKWEIVNLDGTTVDNSDGNTNGGSLLPIALGICGGVAVIAAAGVLLIIMLKKRKKKA